jgi:translocator protein
MVSLLVFIAFVAAAATVASQFGPSQWYIALQKPDWTPPNWLFGPVWTLLYVGIAVAGWLVWRAKTTERVKPFVLWAVQLMLNALWPWIFFGLQRPNLAFADIVFLLIAICGFIVIVRETSLPAAWIFLPYALWVGFAAALNFTIWRLNPITAG